MDQKRKGIILIILLMVVFGTIVFPMKMRWVKSASDIEIEEVEKRELYELKYEELEEDELFYKEVPAIEIINHDPVAVTRFIWRNETEEIEMGVIEGKEERYLIKEESFNEGEQTLEVWMEEPLSEKEWMEVKDSRKQITFRLDRKKPLLSMTAPNGFGVWYNSDVPIHVEMKDQIPGAGLKEVRCLVNGKVIQQVDLSKNDRNELDFLITEHSYNGNALSLCIELTDLAGNQVSQTEMLYVDQEYPMLQWSGIADYSVSGEMVSVTSKAADENTIAKQSLLVEFCDVKGKKHSYSIEEWDKVENGYIANVDLKEDGSYILTANIQDCAGHSVTEQKHVTIDQQNPVIRYVEQLGGCYLPFFEWNYKLEDTIIDDTAYDYVMKLDGNLYLSNERITREGPHIFQVDAVDAAGNQSIAKAVFVIDHTPPMIDFGTVENGKHYEDNMTLSVSTFDKKDIIEQIKINGMDQRINRESTFFQFPFQEPGEYEVMVSAVDLAGNRSWNGVYFTVEKKKTVTDVIKTPMKTVIRKFNPNQKTNMKKKFQPEKIIEEEKTRGEKGRVIGICVCGTLAVLGYRILLNKKNPSKREDAK